MQTSFLSSEECVRLRAMLRKGQGKAHVLNRARILLKLDCGIRDHTVADDVFVSTKTVGRVMERYEQGGLDRALYDLPRPGQPPKITEKVEVHLVTVACSTPPRGRTHWTLELLAKRLIKDHKGFSEKLPPTHRLPSARSCGASRRIHEKSNIG